MVAGLVRRDEEWVEREGAPGGADGAQAAELLGRDAKEDLVQRIGRQVVGSGGGGAQLRGRHRERGGGEQAIAGDEMSEGKAPGGESMAAALV